MAQCFCCSALKGSFRTPLPPPFHLFRKTHLIKIYRRLTAGALMVGTALGLFAASQYFFLREEKPIAISFEAGVPAGHSEGDLMLHRADYALQTCCAHSSEVVGDPAGSQRPVRVFRVEPQDPLVKGSSRSELRLLPSPMGQHVWYRARVFVPQDWKPSPRHVVAMQWHGTRDWLLLEPGKVPPLDITITGNRWEIQKSWDDRIATPMGGSVQGFRKIGEAPLETGKWLEWTIEVTWSSGANGRLRLWLGDRLVVDDHGPNAHRDLIGPYMKVGVYIPSWHFEGTEPGISQRSLYFSDVAVRFGADPFGVITHDGAGS